MQMKLPPPSVYSALRLDNRVKPSISAQGGNTTVYSTGDYVATSNGTFSSPIIAGMTACLWQANPEKQRSDECYHAKCKLVQQPQTIN